MLESQLIPTESKPYFSTWGPVQKLEWCRAEDKIEMCLAVLDKNDSLKIRSNIISKINGAHELRRVKLRDAELLVSASSNVEIYERPQPSDSKSSKMTYAAREVTLPRGLFVQVAYLDEFASIHGHEPLPDIWETYTWVKGELGLLLPDDEMKVVNEKSKSVTIPGGLNHQAVGRSKESSITIITTNAKEHIPSPTL